MSAFSDLQLLTRQRAQEQGQEDQVDEILRRRRAVIGIEHWQRPSPFGVRHFA